MMNKLKQGILSFIQLYKQQLKSNRINKKLKKYYIEGKVDKKSAIAKFFDYIGIRMIVFFLCLTFFITKIKNLWLVLFVSFLCTSIFHRIDAVSRKIKNHKMIYKKRKYFGGQRFIREIIEKNIEELNLLIHAVIRKYGLKEIDSKVINSQNVLLKAVYKDTKIGILGNKYSNTQHVQLKEVKYFYEQLKEQGIGKGIVMTTTDFTKECYEYIRQKAAEVHMILMNKEKWLQMADQVGIFPSEEEIDEYVLDKIESQQKELIKYKEIFLAKIKVKKYLILSVFLFAWSKFTDYVHYYTIMAFVLFGLAGITIYSNMKAGRKQEFRFDQLFRGK